MSASPEGALFLATAEKGVIAAFDIALNPVQLAGAGEEDHASAGGNLLDLGTHFKAAPRGVKGGAWAPVGERRTGTGLAFTTFLVRVQGGPLVTVRFTTGVLTDGLLSPLQVLCMYNVGVNSNDRPSSTDLMHHVKFLCFHV